MIIISSGSGVVPMQSTSCLSSGYYRVIDQNVGGNGSLWQVLSNGTACKIERVYNVVPEPSGSDQFLAYNKELLKQIMLKHEAIFKNQVHELHRLYGRQRELMNEISRNHIEIQASSSKLMPSQMQCNISQNALQIPHPLLDVKPNVQGGENFQMHSISDSLKNAQAGTRINLKENASEEQRVQSSKSHYYGKKMFDLELPAEEYIDSEDEEGLEERNCVQVPQLQENTSETASQSPTKSNLNLTEASSPNGSSNYSKPTFLFDLNEPIELGDSENPTSAHFIDSSMEIVPSDKDSSQISKSESPTRNAESTDDVPEGKGIDGCSSLVSEVAKKDDEIFNANNQSVLSSCLTDPCSPPVVISNEAKTEASISVSSPRKSFEIVQALPCFNNPEFLSNGLRSSTPSSGIKRKYCNSKRNPTRSASLGSISCCLTSNSDIEHAVEDGSLSECIKEPDHTKSAGKNLDEPVSPENKEHPPFRGGSEDYQIEMQQKTRDLNEDLERVAAEAIVSISSLGIQQCLKNYDESGILEVSSDDYLSWFAGLVSSFTGDSEIEFVSLSNDASSSDHHNVVPTSEAEHIEAMSGIKIEDQGPVTPNQKSKTRHHEEKGRPRKTRQRRYISSLPSDDVTENLEQTEQLITAAGSRTSASVASKRNVDRNGSAKRRRSLKKASSHEISFTLGSLLVWGRTYRRQKRRRSVRGNYCFYFE